MRRPERAARAAEEAAAAAAAERAAEAAAKRARQAEKEGLKAELNEFEVKLGRKLKQSDLAAYPELAAKYRRFCELKKPQTPRS